MAEQNTIATAYVQILPSTQGVEGTLANAIVPAAAAAGSSAGVTAGASLFAAAKKKFGVLGGIIGVTAIGKAVKDFASESIAVGRGFDAAMSQVVATMGYSIDELNDKSSDAYYNFATLRTFARDMGATTAFSATQAAEALNYMALAGYDVNTSISMLPTVLNLAAAGNFDLARASDMVTDTQTAFGLSLERTSQLVDEMAKAASTGNTSVEQLGDAFLTVGGLAKELNGGFVQLADGTMKPVDGIQELEIALTAMANAGIKGSEAGTHMRNMLLKLASPTSDGTLMLENLGVAVFDTEGKMRSLSDIFGDLGQAMSALTQEQKIQAISQLFNTRDMASAEALLSAIGEDWDNIGAAILDAQGAAARMAETQLDNLEGDMTKFESALSEVHIAMSDKLEPVMRSLYQAATKGLEKIGAVIENIPQETIDQLADDIGNVLVGAFDLLAGAIEFLGSHYEEIKAFFEGAAGAALFLTNPLAQLESLFQFVAEAGASSASMLSAAFTTAGDMLNTVFGTISGAISAFVNTIIGFFSNLQANIQSIFAAIGQFMQNPVQNALNFIQGIPGRIIGFFAGLGSRIASAIGNIHFPTPHVSWQTLSVFGMSTPIQLPHIEWYKRGGMVDGASIIGAGEAGAELVWPSYEPYMQRYASAIAQEMPNDTGVSIDEIISLLQQLVNKDSSVYLDGSELAKATIGYTDALLGARQTTAARGIA